MKIFKYYVKLIDSINEKIGFLTSWLTSIMVLIVCCDVFTRYFMKKSSSAIQELEWHIFSVIFLLGASYTLKHDRHVRVDVIYSRLSNKSKALINLLGSIIFLIPFCAIVIWCSRNFVISSYNLNEVSPDPGGLPYRFILKAIIPLSFLLLLLQGISLTFSSFLDFIKQKNEIVGDK